MTPAQIALIRVSFAAVKPIADTAATLFYGRLFELDPSLRPMFKRDMDQQGRMLMQMIGVAVASLDRLETLVPVLHDLGRRHGDYGVRDKHYDTIAEALLWTLQAGLGEKFTADVREAWVTVYGVLAGTMKAGAAAARAKEAAA